MKEAYDLRTLTVELTKSSHSLGSKLSIFLLREGTALAAYDPMWTFLWS
jgi:hypothetical protein